MLLTAEEAKEKPKTIFVEVVPKEAKEVRVDVFRLEEDGKKIIYIRTPFGVTRREQTAEMEKIIEVGPPMGIIAKESGDEYIFERMTPFGKGIWKKKKGSQEKLDLLTGDEKDALAYTQRLLESAAEKKAEPQKQK
jgi:hypothetical protein